MSYFQRVAQGKRIQPKREYLEKGEERKNDQEKSYITAEEGVYSLYWPIRGSCTQKEFPFQTSAI